MSTEFKSTIVTRREGARALRALEEVFWKLELLVLALAKGDALDRLLNIKSRLPDPSTKSYRLWKARFQTVLDLPLVQIAGEVKEPELLLIFWYEESVGHYDGDALVVDTIGLAPKSFVDNYRTPHTDKMHIVERFHLIDGGKQMQIHITVDDPDTFNQPWQGLRTYRRMTGALEEEICAENNQHLFDYHIPIAAKSDY